MSDVEPLEVGHVVLKVRDLDRSTSFYEGVLGFRKGGEIPGRMVFFTATGENHHDVALLAVGPTAPDPDPRAVGLYHVAIRLPSEEHVRKAYRALVNAGANIVGASRGGGHDQALGSAVAVLPGGYATTSWPRPVAARRTPCCEP